jgi:hypothetical protein
MIAEGLKAALEHAAERAADLSPEEQARLAVQIESAIDNAIWDAQLRDPRNDAAIAALIDEAKRDERLPFPRPAAWTEADEADEEG